MDANEVQMEGYRRIYEQRFEGWTLSNDVAGGVGLSAGLFTAGILILAGLTLHCTEIFKLPGQLAPVFAIGGACISTGVGFGTFTLWQAFALLFFYHPPTYTRCYKCRQQMLHEDKHEKVQV